MNKLLHLFPLARRFSSAPPANVVEKLKLRTLIKITGSEVVDFMQGLITNDMRHLNHGGSMYTLFLNTKGRVLYDTIIYKTLEDNTYLIECDLRISDQLQRHLKMYKLRKKLDIIGMSDELDLYTMYNPDNMNIRNESNINRSNNGVIAPCESLAETFPKDAKMIKSFKNITIYRDPRMFLLGSRIICPQTINVNEQISKLLPVRSASPNENYRLFRYTLGIGEGIDDIPVGNSFPLEANCDYLHGVSFHKGCYLGQELTARTYHTGVIRKRLMPLFFTKVPSLKPKSESILHNNLNLGKMRGIEGNKGLGVLRITQCLELNEIPIGDGVAHTLKPVWWPLEAPKEKVSLQKSD